MAARPRARTPELTLPARRDFARGARESRVFARDDSRSRGAKVEGENRLVRGDNLAAMRWLAGDGFAGKVRLVYIDPPYNSGRTFAEYDDALSEDEWCAMMGPRIDAMRDLLAGDGALFAEIDDTMLAPLHTMLDAAFGRENRVSTVTVVRSASTGHKAINRGPVNVSDFVLIYAKDRKRWRANALSKERAGYDRAYSLFLPNRGEPLEAWRFESLRLHACQALGFAGPVEARRAMGKESLTAAIERFALSHADRVVRFAQPRAAAVSREARALIARSKLHPSKTFRLARAGYKDMILRGGNRLLFLGDKVGVGSGGEPVLVEPMTNVWDDVPFQGIAREGGVVFSRNKKPERLLERILAMGTGDGDWVLDPFLGSGTTAAVAHKMGRRWIGVEQGAQLDTMCLPRLRRVVDGEDQTGISRARSWRGGGGFGVYE